MLNKTKIMLKISKLVTLRMRYLDIAQILCTMVVSSRRWHISIYNQVPEQLSC